MAKRLTDVDRAIQRLQSQIDTLVAAQKALEAARAEKPTRAPKRRKPEAVEAPAREGVR